jgi:hypothetical protein
MRQSAAPSLAGVAGLETLDTEGRFLTLEASQVAEIQLPRSC